MGRHAAIDMPWADGFYTFRLGLEQIEELEEKRDASLFALFRRLSPDVRDARLADIREVLRIGLIGGDMKPVDAMLLVRRYIDERPIDENRDAAYAVVLAGLSRVHTETPPKGGTSSGEATRFDFAAIRGAAINIGCNDVMRLSIGEWAAVVEQWNRANAKTPEPPSVEEFEAAVIASRNVFSRAV
jgi:hypothetical protein